MGICERCIALHDQGFNCAQSVLLSCEDYIGLERDKALALAAGFGGGLRCGEVCGAVSGGLMALGLCYPFIRGDDAAAKDAIAALAVAYTDAFRERFGALRCEEIKGDKSHCGDYMRFAAELAERMIKNEGEKN